MRSEKMSALSRIFGERHTFWAWLIFWVIVQLIHPFFWTIIRSRVWEAPDKWATIFALLLYSLGGALLFAAVFYLLNTRYRKT